MNFRSTCFGYKTNTIWIFHLSVTKRLLHMQGCWLSGSQCSHSEPCWCPTSVSTFASSKPFFSLPLAPDKHWALGSLSYQQTREGVTFTQNRVNTKQMNWFSSQRGGDLTGFCLISFEWKSVQGRCKSHTEMSGSVKWEHDYQRNRKIKAQRILFRNIPVPLRRVLVWISTTAWLSLARPRISNIISPAMMDYKQKTERQQNREKCGVNVILRFPWKLRYEAVGDLNVSVHLFREDKKTIETKKANGKK